MQRQVLPLCLSLPAGDPPAVLFGRCPRCTEAAPEGYLPRPGTLVVGRVCRLCHELDQVSEALRYLDRESVEFNHLLDLLRVVRSHAQLLTSGPPDSRRAWLDVFGEAGIFAYPDSDDEVLAAVALPAGREPDPGR